jgi:bifunctional enzyme CysN/CysC
MSHRSELIATDIEAYLAEHERKDLLRLLTCGSVDDGKSTLIGRLLHDSNLIYQDHLAALESDSLTSGTTGGDIDLALLMDGLKAEREQGITIDVAYRYFSTARRKFIIADTPGHVQYTRNMVTGASNCQLAVILIDARQGVLDQTRRHSCIASLLGIRHVVIAVNKMDLVGYREQAFEEICLAYERFAAQLSPADRYFLPLSALRGDNVVEPSTNMRWFDGPPLMPYLETVDITPPPDGQRLRFPVQLVQRPNRDFRGFSGTVAGGALRRGQTVLAEPSGVVTRVARIVTFDGDRDVAEAGAAVTVTLTDEIDISRGDLLVSPEHRPSRGHDIDATIVWMANTEGRPGQHYLLQSVNGISNASLRDIHHRIDVTSQERVEADVLRLNDIAHCELAADRELLFDAFADDHTTGSFILIDRLSNATVAAGMVTGKATGWNRQPAASLSRRTSDVTEDERAARFNQRPCTVLLTGMTGSGKSSVGLALERWLFDHGRAALRLDGAMLRLGISRDLGFTNPERSENLRRAAEIARLANLQGLLVLVSVQAPEAAVRRRVRDLVGEGRYIEVFLDAPEELRRQRDPSGLYAAADRGDLEQLPGVTSPYDRPTNPDLELDTGVLTLDECVASITQLLTDRGFLGDG